MFRINYVCSVEAKFAFYVLTTTSSLLIESLNVQKVLMLSFGKSAEVEFVSNETDVRVLSKQTLQIIRSQFDHI